MQPVKVVDPGNVLWRRIGAYLVDSAIPALLWLIITVVIHGSFGRFIAGLVVLAVSIANSVVLQGASGASIGKKLIGLVVVDETGAVCGIGKATVRWLLWIVDGFPWCFPAVGLITFFSTKDHQRVGDRIAGTYVVDKSFVGSPPFAMAYPSDPDKAPYRLNTMSAYQSGPLDDPSPAPGTVRPPDGSLPEGATPSPAKPSSDPVWDPDRNAYVRWDARRNCWLTFDEETKKWTPAS